MTKMTDGIADEASLCSYRDHYGFDNESQSIVQLPNVTAVRFTNNEIKRDLSSSQSSVTHFENKACAMASFNTSQVRFQITEGGVLLV